MTSNKRHGRDTTLVMMWHEKIIEERTMDPRPHPFFSLQLFSCHLMTNVLSLPWRSSFIYFVLRFTYSILLFRAQLQQPCISISALFDNCWAVIDVGKRPLRKMTWNAFLQNLSKARSRRSMTITTRTAIICCVETHPQSPVFSSRPISSTKLLYMISCDFDPWWTTFRS